MRTERPTPWGFDVWDPRLDLRRAAAEAQRRYGVVDIPDRENAADRDVSEPPEPEDVEAVGAGSGRPGAR